MLASVVFPAGYTAVDWEFRGFRQGHSSSGRWREGRAMHTSSTGGKERKRQREGEKNELLLRVLFSKCLVDMLSDSEVRGDDCIDRFYLLVVSEKESESRLEQLKLVMQKHTINHHMRLVPNEN